MDELVEKVLRIAALVEDRDDAMAFRLSRLARTLSAAKQTDVKLDSWDDFAAWWNQNRSQGLLFSLVDALGSDNPIIGQMKSVMAEQDQLEAKLHDIYLQLKGQQGTLPSETSAPLTETEPMPAAEPAPALDDGAGGDAADLDAVLDEADAEKGAGVKKKFAAPEGWPSVDDVAQELSQLYADVDWSDPDLAEGLEIRLQVREGGNWQVNVGDAGYDTDHHGFWGSGLMSKDMASKEEAADLIDQAEESHAEAVDVGETSAQARQAAKKDPFRPAEHHTKCPECGSTMAWNTEDGLSGQTCSCGYEFTGREKGA